MGMAVVMQPMQQQAAQHPRQVSAGVGAAGMLAGSGAVSIPVPVMAPPAMNVAVAVPVPGMPGYFMHPHPHAQQPQYQPPPNGSIPMHMQSQPHPTMMMLMGGGQPYMAQFQQQQQQQQQQQPPYYASMARGRSFDSSGYAASGSSGNFANGGGSIHSSRAGSPSGYGVLGFGPYSQYPALPSVADLLNISPETGLPGWVEIQVRLYIKCRKAHC
jgi:hypothetical protein